MPLKDPQLAVARRGQNTTVAGGDRFTMEELLPIWTREQLVPLENLEELYDSRPGLWERFLPPTILPTIVDLLKDNI